MRSLSLVESEVFHCVVVMAVCVFVCHEGLG